MICVFYLSYICEVANLDSWTTIFDLEISILDHTGN